MAETLNELERRVLGVLIEKSLGQPDYYPMTLNAVVAACNQKQNRDPIMQLDDETVARTLNTLKDHGLVALVLPSPGGRTNRYRHDIENHFGWQKRQRAVMAELLLRGPQTPGELRTRCTRLFPFEGLEAVAIVLESLEQCEPPMVATLPRVPGQSAVRYAHLLYPEGEAPTAKPETTAVRPAPATDEANVQSQVNSVWAELASLRETVADLQERLAAIEKQLL
ncbi:MAG: YceH family protein [Phycisphaerae bacterium]|nr:YceH family protein [Phycisphaerae bacterium]